jgi:HEAT repeat protein/ATP/ADP translocase
MLLSVLKKRLGLSEDQLKRLGAFLLLALTLVGTQGLASLLSRSLFLANAGADKLPLLYTLTPICIITISGLFSQVIGQFSHKRLLQLLLLASALFMLGLRILGWLESGLYILFIFYIFSEVVSVLVIKIGFWNLVADYFTALELKRYTSYLNLASSLGYLLANTIAGIALQVIKPSVLVMALPVLYGLAIAEMVYIEIDQNDIEVNEPQQQGQTLRDSLHQFPQLISRYPIVLFLTANTFLLLLLRLLGEYQYSAIYANTLGDAQKLGSFLALMASLLSVLEFGLSSLVTPVLIQKLGVRRMNLIYPLATLASFIGLWVAPGLGSAVFTNINQRSLNYGMAEAVRLLNYNAVPPRILGRFRVLSEGLFSPIGQVLGGLILLSAQQWGSLSTTALLGIGLSIIYSGVGYFTGRSYLDSLMSMVTEGLVNLEGVKTGWVKLPASYQEEVKKMLTGDDRQMQLLGLQLATRLQNPSQVLPEVQTLFSHTHPELRQGVVRFLSQIPSQDQSVCTRHLLESTDRLGQAIALELLIVCQQPVPEPQRSQFWETGDPEIRALILLADLQTSKTSLPDDLEAWAADFPPQSQQNLIHIIARTGNPDLFILLDPLIRHAPLEVQQRGLEYITRLNCEQFPQIRELAASQLGHGDPLVRATAIEILGKAPEEKLFPYLAQALTDDHPHVREQAAQALAHGGERALPWVEPHLESPRAEVVDAAIATLGYMGTPRAEDRLYEYLAPQLQQFSRSWHGLQQVPPGCPQWQLLAIAIRDYQKRVLDRVFHTLSTLGCSETLDALKQVIHSQNLRDRANAVETIASLRYRRFVQPLLPLLETWASGQFPQQEINVDAQWMKSQGYKLILESLASQDRWLELGAMVALVDIPQTLIQTPDPLVQQVAKTLFPTGGQSCQHEQTLERIYILTRVNLFHHFSLDELLLINQELIEEHFAPEQLIIAEGSLRHHLYILASGTVQIVKTLGGKRQILATLHSGDYFGESQLFNQTPAWVDVIAQSNCTLLKLESDRFLDLVYQKPDMIIEICKRFSAFLKQSLEETEITV